MWVKKVAVLIAAVMLWRWLFLPLPEDADQVTFTDTPAVAAKHGYKVETHQVETADGYLLTLHRIPSSGPPVLVQHGYLQNSATFLISGPGIALGYLLADSGYDVWLGNSRGNFYSRGNANSSISQQEYYDFSYHEMGVYDLPAIIDTILNMTAREQLYYVGFSMGATIFFVMASSRPQYNNKVAAMVALAPAAFNDHTTSTLAYYTFVGSHYLQWLLDALHIYQLFPRTQVFVWLTANLCGSDGVTGSICPGFYSMLGGHNPNNMNRSVLAAVFEHDPSGGSRKTAAHYGQGILSGSFRQFDYVSDNLFRYGQPQPPDYDLSKISVPITVFYGGADTLIIPQDVERLYSKLTHSWPRSLHLIHEYSHMDFSCGMDASKRVYKHIVSYFDNNL